MSDISPQFEVKDNLGTTTMYSGTVDQTGIFIPTVATTNIDQVGIRCTLDQVFNSRLEFSYDSGSNWFRLGVGESREDELRGSIKQIKIRAAGVISTCKYEVILNRGPD